MDPSNTIFLYFVFAFLTAMVTFGIIYVEFFAKNLKKKDG